MEEGGSKKEITTGLWKFGRKQEGKNLRKSAVEKIFNT